MLMEMKPVCFLEPKFMSGLLFVTQCQRRWKTMNTFPSIVSIRVGGKWMKESPVNSFILKLDKDLQEYFRSVVYKFSLIRLISLKKFKLILVLQHVIAQTFKHVKQPSLRKTMETISGIASNVTVNKTELLNIVSIWILQTVTNIITSF